MEICINLGSALNAEELKSLERTAESRGFCQEATAQMLVKEMLLEAGSAVGDMEEENRSTALKTISKP